MSHFLGENKFYYREIFYYSSFFRKYQIFNKFQFEGTSQNAPDL